MSDTISDDASRELREPVIVITKSSRVLELFDRGLLVKRYPIALGSAPKGNKLIEGDGRTPEGEFYVCVKNPKSKFHLSFGISYPSKDAAERGLNAGHITPQERDEIANAIDQMIVPPQKTKLGGEIYIHGGGTAADWTDGCVALANDEIAELFAAVPIGTRVLIVP